ncbi:outer membrane beta-barrel protein [Helicobacter trogontum]|uniref:outer membrane beta-barrel protein n=1 Tax=Helicobacter trogontum TaxID=50960 RepID=UPI0031197479
MKTGLDLSYIFNFYNQGVHEVGFGVGIGYGVNTYFSSNGQITDFLNEISILKARNLIIHGVYPTLGFYYTLQQHHKFEINYRYTGFIQQSRPDDTIVLESSGKALGPIYHKLQYSSYFVLNYSYIF